MTRRLDLWSRGSWFREPGFTFIELMIVIAMIAVSAAVSIPQLIEKRKGANEEAAIGALRTLTTAQSLFREGDKDGNGVADYAGSLHALADSGLIDPVLATGRAHGYAYFLSTSDDRLQWSAVAAPAAVNRSGDHTFTVDETEVVVTECPPGQHLDPFTGECVPDDTFVSDAAISVAHAIDVLANGMALPAAKTLATLVPDLPQQFAIFMDKNHDEFLSFDEALNGDILGPPLRPLLEPLTSAVRRDLALGVANEQLQVVPVTAIGGDLLEFLDRVPPFVPSPAGR